MDIHFGGIYQHSNDYMDQIILKRSFGGQNLTWGPYGVFEKSAFIKKTPPVTFFLDQHLECLGLY